MNTPFKMAGWSPFKQETTKKNKKTASKKIPFVKGTKQELRAEFPTYTDKSGEDKFVYDDVTKLYTSSMDGSTYTKEEIKQALVPLNQKHKKWDLN